LAALDQVCGLSILLIRASDLRKLIQGDIIRAFTESLRSADALRVQQRWACAAGFGLVMSRWVIIGVARQIQHVGLALSRVDGHRGGSEYIGREKESTQVERKMIRSGLAPGENTGALGTVSTNGCPFKGAQGAALLKLNYELTQHGRTQGHVIPVRT
jgi:hypothetical protein